MKLANCKNGISLIAVLMFMLAATTASVVVFKWIGSENFSSAARLKNNEAYQASQAGLENVRGWLTNMGADAGALIRNFEIKGQKPILLNFKSFKMESTKKQNFSVYLTGIDVSKQPYQLKFLSVGEARDGAKYSQAAIFDVEGLYKMKASELPKPSPGNAKKVPPYFGSIGKSTQQTVASAHVIGNLDATAGLSTTGDLIVTGNYTMASGVKVGCPIIGNDPNQQKYTSRPTNYDALVKDTVFGNAYIKEDLKADASRYCGSLYVGGNMNINGSTEIWGDLYVKGNLNLNQKLTVYGNVTIIGNITFRDMQGNPQSATMDFSFKKNLLLPGINSTYETPAKKITVDGTTCKVGNIPTPPPPVSNTIQTKATEQECKSITGGGASLLEALGKQLTTSKEDSNGNPCTTGPDCMYRIRDPITLGAAVEDWKVSKIPGGCATLNGYASSNGIIDLPIAGVTSATFVDAVNSCYNNSSGNWTDANGNKWLVIRINYNSAYNEFSKQTLGTSNHGNFIIIVENKPGSDGISPPLTTERTNVLLYLKQGATTIEMKPDAGKFMNYFIYSEQDIDKITGSQYLKGNLFMKNGKKVKEMYDFHIQDNDPLFDALSKAGVIVDNKDKCKGTGLDDCGGEVDDSKPPPKIEPPSDGPNPELSYVPTVPHLKVKMQSVYASTEPTDSYDEAMKAILVMPRVIYLKSIPSNTSDLAKYFKVLYLNDASGADDNTIKSNTKCYNTPLVAGKGHVCSLNLTGTASCTDNNLLCNAFYVVIGDDN
ncbi:MAG: hypothetical protein LBC87_05140 [Fibromonadaceae bacterium]|jgi:hypothetical protein|nr:hypothetical protein [Fibromonadaceae bacterium]